MEAACRTPWSEGSVDQVNLPGEVIFDDKIFFMALIIFDFDGVLADTLDDLILFGQQACDELGVKHLVIKDDLSHLEAMSFATFGQACEVPEDQGDEFVQSCLSHFADKKTPPAIFSGLSEVVRKFAVTHTIVIVTTNSSQNVNAFLLEHGLDQCVDEVYGVGLPGSKADKITLARIKFAPGAARDSVFMVGDSLSDMHSAQEAEVTSIAVTWGHQSLGHLLRGQPDYVANSAQELAEIIAGRPVVQQDSRLPP